MALVSNLERRDAVYYWRRRPPVEIACRIERSHLKISLRTMDSRTARFRGAQMSAFAETLFAMPVPAILSPAQARDFFTAAFSQHLTKLMQLKEIDRADGRGLDAIANLERARGHAYRMLSQFGAQDRQAPSDEDRNLLLDQGLSEIEADRTLAELAEIRKVTISARSIGKIEGLLATIGAEVNARNVTASRNIYHRALGEALLRNAGSAVDDLPYADLVDQAITSLMEAAAGGAVPQAISTAGVAPTAANIDAIITAPKAGATPGSTLVELGKLLGENKRGGDLHWTEKTASQAEFIFDLLQRFVAERFGSSQVAALRQDWLAAFDQFIRNLPKKFGKSRHDKARSIAEIERLAAELKPSERGLSIGTRNRHWTFIGQLIAFARANGLKPDRDLEVKSFRVRQTTPARDQRPMPKIDAVARIFHTLIYTGYADWRYMKSPGDLVYHRAAYWVPIIVHYSGMRREEACGLSIDDIGFASGIPYFDVRPNEFRRLKNAQSKRKIAIHPELIRLGFLEYFNAIVRAEYKRLFPDLYSPTSNSLLGDRLYKEIAPALKLGGVSSHAYRHFFDDQLKQGDVRDELRADLMGHAGDSETTNRYCDPIQVSKQLLLLEKLPKLTGHLEPIPAKLLNWVERREIAPWSKAAKRPR